MPLLKAPADGESATKHLENMVTRYYPYFRDIFPTQGSLANFAAISMQEGNTPLVMAAPFAKEGVLDYLEQQGIAGLNLYFKLEWADPTGSMKDRGMAVAVAKAKEEGFSTIVCASTGNTSAAAAAYGARAGMNVLVLITEGTPEAKVMQAASYGARIITYGKSFDETQLAARELERAIAKARIVNSNNDNRIKGQRTAAFEISDALGNAPDYLLIPVGNAGNITAYGLGFKEYLDAGRNTRMPVVIGARASEGTDAQAIRIREPNNKDAAYRIAKETGGTILEGVPDDEMRVAHKALRKEGLLTELASAISLAALPRFAKMQSIPQGSSVVMVLTGNGLKDSGISMKYEKREIIAAKTQEELMQAATYLTS